jgi:hypothetical protein
MGFGRFLKKAAVDALPGGYIGRILKRAVDKEENPLKAVFNDVKETICEDAPGTSHLYKAGKHDGEKKGRADQAETDAKKFDEMNAKHEEDSKRWEESDRKKDDHIKRQDQRIHEQEEIIDTLRDNQ